MMLWTSLVKAEFKAIFSNIPLLITVFFGVIFYSFLYPLPYKNQTPTELPIIVVDADNTAFSRKLTRMIDATPQITVVRTTSSLNDAEQALVQESIMGYVIIPKHFYKHVLQGKSPPLSFGGDGSLFLVFGTIIEGVSYAIGTLNATLKIQHATIVGEQFSYAATHFNATGLQLSPLFNVSGGYLNYVVPAVFILILHQTLLIAVGLLGSDQKVATNSSYWVKTPTWKLLCVRIFLFMLIYLPLCTYYLGPMFIFYDIPRHAQISELFLITSIFLVAVISLGMCLGYVVRRSEHVTVVVLLSSLPVVFLSGFIWPIENIPTLLLVIFNFVPAIPAIKLYLGLNQLGAELYQLTDELVQLCSLTCFYLLLSYYLLSQKSKCQG